MMGSALPVLFRRDSFCVFSLLRPVRSVTSRAQGAVGVSFGLVVGRRYVLVSPDKHLACLFINRPTERVFEAENAYLVAV